MSWPEERVTTDARLLTDDEIEQRLLERRPDPELDALFGQPGGTAAAPEEEARSRLEELFGRSGSRK